MRYAEICFKVKIELFWRDGEFTIFEVIWNRGISEGWDNPCRRIIRDSPWLRSKKKRGRRSSPLSRRSLRPSANFSWYIVPSSLFLPPFYPLRNTQSTHAYTRVTAEQFLQLRI